MDRKRYIATGKDLLIRFFNSPYYPPFVCALVLLGYFSGLEAIFGSFNILLFCLSLWLTDSARHVLIVAGTFMYQISPGHAPTVPSYSDYFFTGIRPYLIAFLIAVLAVSFLAYVRRTEVYRSFNFKDCPLIGPMLMLASAFLLNGTGSDTYAFKDFLLGFAEAGAYFIFFLLFYFGFRKKDLEDIEKYFCSCTLLMAATILVQLAMLYLFGDVYREDGAINVYVIHLGWGVSTVIGAHLAVLIPVLLYGAMHRPHPRLYFIMACLTLLGCFLSMSRTALGVGVLFFGIGVLIGCFYGKRKTLFQITSLLIVLFILITLIGFFDDLRRLFAVYFEKGFSTSGRWSMWKQCVDAFFDHPLFGAGFFGVGLSATVSHFAHNTIMQMIGACGLYGIIAYFIYRIETVFLYLNRPTLFKTMMGLSAAALVVASLLDIFLFSFFSMIYHSALLALTAILNREEDAVLRLQRIKNQAPKPDPKNGET